MGKENERLSRASKIKILVDSPGVQTPKSSVADSKNDSKNTPEAPPVEFSSHSREMTISSLGAAQVEEEQRQFSAARKRRQKCCFFSICA